MRRSEVLETIVIEVAVSEKNCSERKSLNVPSTTLALSNTMSALKPAHSVIRGSLATGAGNQCLASPPWVRPSVCG
ncbi:hypothetical protein EVAR_75779_1 [Eumeta japonica]|uniref:Uncharacterized protein n=1 Tax=Eumeta variegata TaxID=151549 RepID=A0A4C1TE05_EUMVA|nr:hypothetical protein EVAR_75779_1 [Eumeta japonica]